MTEHGSALRLLVLGGTAWLGGEVARQAVARGHQVSCLARGLSGTPPTGVDWVRADRAQPGAYDRLADARWDVVVEVSWQPELVRTALRALAPSAAHWVYVSSCSVYADEHTPDADESAALLPPWSGTGAAAVEEYGPAKVSCETASLEAMGPERTLLARAGLIAGHGDPSDRFGYWPARLARMQEPDEPVLAPDVWDQSVQVIDVVDLAGWLLRCAEERISGPLNAVGDPVPFGEVLDQCAAVTGRRPRWVRADPGWLRDHEVAQWAGDESLPLWLPEGYDGFARRDNAAARRAGLPLRPLAATVESALRWERAGGLHRERRAGLSPGRESALITEWESSQR